MSDFTYRAFDPSRREATLRLMDKVQGITTSPAEFTWWFEQNPGGAENLLLATLDGEVVGCNSFTPYVMSFGGVRETVGFPQKICVDEVCRGKGVFLKMQKRLEEVAGPRGVKLLLGFPNANAYPIWTGKWSCLDLPALRLQLRVEEPAAVLARAKVPRVIGRILGAPYRLLVGRGKAKTERGDLRLAPITRFDARADALWDRFEPSLPPTTGMIVRSAAYLNWRYLDAPSGRYRALGLWRGEELLGYAAVGTMKRYGLRLGLLADLLVDPDPALGKAARALLLDGALGLLRESGVEAVAALRASDPAGRALLASRLFLPTPRRFPVIGKALDGDANRNAAILREGGLRFTLGDLDFF